MSISDSCSTFPLIKQGSGEQLLSWQPLQVSTYSLSTASFNTSYSATEFCIILFIRNQFISSTLIHALTTRFDPEYTPSSTRNSDLAFKQSSYFSCSVSTLSLVYALRVSQLWCASLQPYHIILSLWHKWYSLYPIQNCTFYHTVYLTWVRWVSVEQMFCIALRFCIILVMQSMCPRQLFVGLS